MPPTSSEAAATSSASEGEYVQLKLELSQVTAATDTKRLQSRKLISERDGIREDTEKITEEAEGQQVCVFVRVCASVSCII